MIVQAIRSIIFYILFVVATVILAGIVTIGALIPPWSRVIAHGCAWYWTFAVRYLLWLTVGIKSEVTGQENIPEGACIIASKHQSDWDTAALYSYLDHPAFIAKAELFKIPLVGTTLRKMGTISINRKSRGGALAGLIEQGKEITAEGRRIFIFPEGTRKVPLSPPDYRFGTAKLYAALDLPVVPVALNSGLFWGRNSLILWPGTARARFLPPIPPGLDPKEMQARLINDIEKASTEMILNAVDAGLSRPVDDDFRQRINEARSDKPES